MQYRSIAMNGRGLSVSIQEKKFNTAFSHIMQNAIYIYIKKDELRVSILSLFSSYLDVN